MNEIIIYATARFMIENIIRILV